MEQERADVRVPWRRSLLVRLVGIGSLIALVAVAAATWATVTATAVAVREAQQDSLHTDARAYDALVGYAAGHPRWAGAGDLVRRLARDLDRRVTVTDEAGRVLADSDGDGGTRSPARARAALDPLAIDPILLAGGRSDTATEPAGDLAAVPAPRPEVPGTGQAACDRRPCRWWTIEPPAPVDERVAPLVVAGAVGAVGPSESPSADSTTTASPQRWRALRRGADACLARAGLPRSLQLTAGFGLVVDFPQRHGIVAQCADQARRAWYDGRVAPPALMFVSGDEGSVEVFWDLSGRSQIRILLLAGGVLAVTLALCLLLASGVVRPLRRMALAAHRAGDGDLEVRVPERGGDEVAQVARAFNRMADRRQQLEEARRRLVSDVSHELRAPLANVRGWIEAAEDGLVTPDDRLLANLHEETLHLQRLVDDLHDLALGDAGELRLAPVDLDVGELLEQTAASFRAASDAAGVDVRVEATPGLSLWADPVRLRQAVDNLVANALRHTAPDGTVTLRGRDGVVEVADTGSGIPAEELPHVFERFRRADPARSRATGGSGLGLAIVRQIVEAHGGAASIASTEGIGTTVRLTLPRRDPHGALTSS